MPKQPYKQYIGDGVYADWDGDMIVLTTENGVEITNTIYLEWPVWTGLQRYVTRLQERIEDESRLIYEEDE